MPTDAQPFLDGLHFGEGPRWHDGRLWYSDFYDHAVLSVDVAGDRRTEAEVPGQPSGLGWLPDGRLLVVSMTDRLVLRREADGTMVRHADLRPWATFHANDMVVGADGRAYVGNFGFDLDAFYEGQGTPTTASMVRVDPDGTAGEAAAGLHFPNGAVLADGGRTLVVAESFAGVLTAFDVGADGSLTGRRVWAKLEHCAPDGICLDAEGCIWVANAVTNECRRVAEGGEVLDTVTTSQLAVAPVLGGADGRTLYVCTAPGTAAKEVRDVRLGKVEQARVAVAGPGFA